MVDLKAFAVGNMTQIGLSLHYLVFRISKDEVIEQYWKCHEISQKLSN